jgi:hypothetical protein
VAARPFDKLRTGLRLAAPALRRLRANGWHFFSRIGIGARIGIGTGTNADAK